MGIGSFLGAINPVAAIGSALSMGGDILAYKGQKDTNEMNQDIAREQMAFQERMANNAMDFSERMSSTSYQRAMEDMKSSGLNPILAYQQGGASTPIGQSAQGAAIAAQNPSAVFSGTSNRLAGMVSTAADVSLKGEQQNMYYHMGRQAATQAGVNQITSDRIAEEIAKIGSEIEQIKANTQGIEFENVEREILAEFYQSAEFASIARKFGLSVPALRGIFSTVFGKAGVRR